MASRQAKRLYELEGKRLLSSASARERTSILYPLLGSIVLATAGVTKYVHDNVGGTEGLVRSLSFYRYASRFLKFRFKFLAVGVVSRYRLPVSKE